MKIAFGIVTVAMIYVIAAMYSRQNRAGRSGGPIALSKAIWLHYTLYTWFFVLPYAYYRLPDAPVGDRTLWAAFALSMWIRGAAEAVMLFKTKNWTPIIGISHDIFTFGLMVWAYSSGARAEIATDPAIAVFSGSMLLSILVETHHAASFFAIMRGKTQGDGGLWYAHKGDPRFRRILRATTFFNGVLYSALIYFLVDRLY